jgi:hypothetical protein
MTKLTTERPMPRLTQATTLSRSNIQRLDPRHTRNINHPSRLMLRRAFKQQRLTPNRHIKHTLNIQIIQLVPRMLGVIIVIVPPTRSRIIHQHRQPIRLLFQLLAQVQAAGFVLEVCDDVGAFSGAEGVEARGGGLEFGFFARGDEDARSVLDEGLCGHFAEARGAAGYEDDVLGEVEECGDREVVFGGGVRHLVDVEVWFSGG